MRRPLLACVLLLAVYAGLSFANDTHGTLGTDTGGKVATLRTMESRGLDPDVGYWAARWDPHGDLHPLFYTSPIGAKWVNVTTLPVLYAAEPLFRLGGYRLALLLPMLGSVLAALAAAAVARRLGADGWLAFVVVGLLSPLAIYALDFWEHSIGVALMAWAVVLLLDVLDRGIPRPWPRALGAGLLFGAAATLRTEALVYAAVATAAVCLVLLFRRRRLGLPVLVGLVVTFGLLLPLAGNTALEQATVGGTIRTARTSGSAAEAGRGARLRLEEGLLTAVGLYPEVSWKSVAVGGGMLLLLVVASWAVRRRRELGPAVVGGGGAAALVAVRFTQGLGFIPGMTAAGPVAAIGLGGGWSSSQAVGSAESTGLRRLLLAIAVAALPIVWAFQFLGGAYAQWGGRYVLMSGFLLTVLGAAALERAPRPAAVGALALAASVTVFGLLWLSSRTHDVARAEAALYGRRDAVLISRVAHLAREGGAYYRYGGRPWLTAVTDAQEQAAVGVVREAGMAGFAVVDDGTGSVGSFGGFRPEGTSHVEFLGLRLRLTSYRAASSVHG